LRTFTLILIIVEEKANIKAIAEIVKNCGRKKQRFKKTEVDRGKQ